MIRECINKYVFGDGISNSFQYDSVCKYRYSYLIKYPIVLTDFLVSVQNFFRTSIDSFYFSSNHPIRRNGINCFLLNVRFSRKFNYNHNLKNIISYNCFLKTSANGDYMPSEVNESYERSQLLRSKFLNRK